MISDIQHRPWIGSSFGKLAGQKVVIVGYSHWSDEPDRPSFTEEQVTKWSKGGEEEPAPFATRIRAYFDSDSPAQFWNSVAFFNTYPRLIGKRDHRYAVAPKGHGPVTVDRIERLITEIKPDRIFVFSKKAWKDWPEYSGTCKEGTLRLTDIGEFDCGTYKHPGGEAIAFGFKHPQFSPVEATGLAVKAALAFDPRTVGG